MNILKTGLLAAALGIAVSVVLVAQPPAGAPPGGAPKGGAPGGGPGGPGGAGKGKGPGGPTFTVTSPSFVDGGEIPAKYTFRGDNKSPAFEFHWLAAGTDAAAPATLQSYVVIFHDMENSTARSAEDTLHWSAFNVPATAKGLPEGLAAGDLPDGTRNGPGIAAGRGAASYFGPGAGPGPFHHYMFEFYALDTKLDLPATVTAITRDNIIEGMKGHVIGKAVYGGRYHQAP